MKHSLFLTLNYKKQNLIELFSYKCVLKTIAMKKNLLLLLMISIFSVSFAQQKITVTGTVSDDTGELLPGVNIIEKGTINGTASNIDGDYEVKVDENATLLFSFIGYKDIEIAVNGQNKVDAILVSDTETIGEVVITAQAIGQKNAIREQINSNTIKNVVAADRLQENPDANSVEALGRLPGVSVLRSGGEGSQLVIRGLEPKYASVTLNGVKMPSNGGGRGTDISGISQYALQGAEVFKSLTADLEADAVAGTVNLKLREAPKGMHYNAMAQMGYNNMNNYFGNYKLAGDFSNRLFNNKLGVLLSLNAERVTRSTQTMSAGYSSPSTELDILMNGIGLNLIERFNYRRSAMLSLDYKVHPTTTLSFYTLYSYSKVDTKSQSKGYAATGGGYVSYNYSFVPDNINNMVQSAISGLTKLDYMDLEIDYGVAYSVSNNDNRDYRGWNYVYNTVPSDFNFPTDWRRDAYPKDVKPKYSDNGDNLEDLYLQNMNVSNDEISDKNLTAYFNIEAPFEIGSSITGKVKVGATYRNKNRYRDLNDGNVPVVVNQFLKPVVGDALDWVVLDGVSQEITAVGLPDGRVDNFLDGQFDFGHTFSWDRLNEMTDVWSNYSEDLFALGEEEWSKIIPKEKLGYHHNILNSTMNDQSIVENYYAGYLLGEFNFGEYVMFLPGLRYEKTTATMQGFDALEPVQPPPVYAPIDGSETSADRGDEFWLPMIHLRVKPSKSFYVHMAYTQTLSRPSFDQISPNSWTNTGFPPFAYSSRDPNLKAERWENFDAQFTVHGKKLGLFSVTGFYKKAQDKIWWRSFNRLKGDPIVPPFPDASLVQVSGPENHDYDINLKGVELELQTSFWYLPKPFSFFTASLNYTYTASETQYPLSWIENVVPPGGGRPVATRKDSTVAGPMLFQPKHIANASLGFNREGLNIWLSFQYNGEIVTGKNYTQPAFDPIKQDFYRWDLQIVQKLKGKLEGFQIIGNFANLTNFTETSKLRGDVRPTYMESYGWTADLGIRYKF